MRFVLKIGTSLLTDKKHGLNRDFLANFIDKAAQLKKIGHKIVIVSSGAVASGRSEMSFEREEKNIPYRQCLAAVGQGLLMEAYREFFSRRDIVVAQALLTNYDFVNRENFLNTKNVFELLLKKGVVPIVNENDVTTVAELKFGDNDMLSAKTAAMVSADYLCIFTDVDGLHEEDPRKNPDAKFIPVVEKIDASVRKFASGAASSSSLGGMITKLEAAAYVTSVGISMFIINGNKKDRIEDFIQFCRAPSDFPSVFGTYFPSSTSRAER